MKTGENLQDTGLAKDILNNMGKIRAVKAKIDKYDYFKIRRLIIACLKQFNS